MACTDYAERWKTIGQRLRCKLGNFGLCAEKVDAAATAVEIEAGKAAAPRFAALVKACLEQV